MPRRLVTALSAVAAATARGALTELRLVVLDGGKERTPPTEFRIFPMGKVATSKGTFLFDDKAAASVMAEYARQGNELSIDYEHQAVSDPPIRAPAAAWFRLEVRKDGLWAVKVRWLDTASAHLRAGEYRYFSPAFTTEEKTGRILRLINVALTNIPATKNMTPLVAADDRSRKGTNMGAKKAKGSTTTAAKDASKAKKPADETTKGGAGVTALSSEECAEETEETTSTSETSDSENDGEAMADGEGEGESEEESADDGEEEDDDEDEEETSEESADDGEDDEEEGEHEEDTSASVAASKTSKKAKAKKTKKTKARKTSDADVLAEVAKLTGTRDMGAQLAKLAALNVAQSQPSKESRLTARVAELEQREIDRKALGLVNRAIKEMRLPPAKKDVALGLAKRDKTLGILRTFLDALPPSTVPTTPRRQPKDDEITVATLAAEDRAVCTKLGIKPEDYVKTKAEQAKRRASA